MHPWHDISPEITEHLEAYAVIEISRGSKLKFEIDKPSGLLRLDRILPVSMHYPLNYGIIPRTRYYDGDPMDVVVFCQEDIPPLSLIRIRLIGGFVMLDGPDKDDKLVGVVVQDLQSAHLNDVLQLPPHLIRETAHFFEQYKSISSPPGTVRVTEWYGPKQAKAVLDDSVRLYQEYFPVPTNS